MIIFVVKNNIWYRVANMEAAHLMRFFEGGRIKIVK